MLQEEVVNSHLTLKVTTQMLYQHKDYNVTVTDENGCSLSEMITVEPAILPDPLDLEGDTEVMIGDSSLYEYEFTPGSSYEWTFFGADSLVVSDIFAISLLWAIEGEGWVCVQETNATGCVGDQVCLEINVGLGIDELNTYSIDAFPNPTPGNLTVASDYLTGSQKWMLIDMNGSIISTGIKPLHQTGTILLISTTQPLAHMFLLSVTKQFLSKSRNKKFNHLLLIIKSPGRPGLFQCQVLHIILHLILAFHLPPLLNHH